MYKPKHSQLEIILIHMEAAFAFNVSREVAESGLNGQNRARMVRSINCAILVWSSYTHWYQLVRVIITYRVAMIKTTWNRDHE